MNRFNVTRFDCGHCGMNTTPTEFHPHWFCVLFENGVDPRQVDLGPLTQCEGYAGDTGASAPRCEKYRGHIGPHRIFLGRLNEKRNAVSV